jgi:hypothetical protein
LIDAYAAAKNTSKTKANQGLLLGAGNGLGTIQNDRGSLVIGVTTPAGEVDLVGEKKAQYDPTLGLLVRQTRTARTNLRHQAHRAGLSAAGLLADPLGLLPWLSPTYTLTGWDPVTWATTTFVTAEWAGARWKGARWKETSWDGARWKGTDWVNTDWTGARWKGSEWDGARWKATNFQSRWYAAAWD